MLSSAGRFNPTDAREIVTALNLLLELPGRDLANLPGRRDTTMVPPPDLVECCNCDCWFAAAATDEVFHHATARCRREANRHPPEPQAQAD